MLLPHDARHNIWFARNYPFGFPCSFISRSDRDSQLHKFESLSFYNLINLVARSGSAVTLSPSLSAAAAPPAAPASGPLLRRSGRSAPAAWSSILGRAPRRAMNFPARCAGCPEPPATPASRPAAAARREASRRHGPPPVAADAKLGRAGKLPRE